jgi:hypothetical protein
VRGRSAAPSRLQAGPPPARQRHPGQRQAPGQAPRRPLVRGQGWLRGLWRREQGPQAQQQELPPLQEVRLWEARPPFSAQEGATGIRSAGVRGVPQREEAPRPTARGCPAPHGVPPGPTFITITTQKPVSVTLLSFRLVSSFRICSRDGSSDGMMPMNGKVRRKAVSRVAKPPMEAPKSSLPCPGK